MIGTVLGPLMAEQAALRQANERQADRIEELARENGRLGAELDMLRAARAQQAANLTPDGPESPPEPGHPFPWTWPPTVRGLRSWPLVAGLAVLVAIVLLAWPW